MAALARRAHSRAELQRKLVRRGYPSDEVESALARAAGNGYLDDAAFARALVRQRKAGRGAAAIGAELRAKGVSREEAATALAEIDDGEELATAMRLTGRSLAPDATWEDRRRAAARLVRRGFAPEVARAATTRGAGAQLE